MVLEDDFIIFDSRKWLFYLGGIKMFVCGFIGDVLVFIEKVSICYVVSIDIVVNEDFFLQIDFVVFCLVIDFCYVIELEYLVDFGLLWYLLVRDCLFINVECSCYYLQWILVLDIFNKWMRIILFFFFYIRF